MAPPFGYTLVTRRVVGIETHLTAFTPHDDKAMLEQVGQSMMRAANEAHQIFDFEVVETEPLPV